MNAFGSSAVKAVADRPVFSSAPRVPPVPTSLRDTGLTDDAITDLIVKALYIGGSRTGQELADFLCLPFPLLDQLVLVLQQRRFLEVKGSSGQSRANYVFDVVGPGRERAREALESNEYVGPLPIPLRDYRKWIERQTIRNVHVDRAAVRKGFEPMVMNEEMLDTLGPAVNSAKSIFLFGDPGNGKTLIADCIATMFGGELYVPWAVAIGGQTMVVYDPVFHHLITPEDMDENSIWKPAELDYDRRFARVKRPVVVAGGELTLEQLDLQYDPDTKLYQAPFQVKANGGILIIDDFGRQRVPARDLLNRWIVPLEKRIDYLTAHTGSKFPIPFDCLLIISTNLNPSNLVEEAFLRRIHYKLHVRSPNRDQYEEIFRRVSKVVGIPYDPSGIDLIYREYYGRRGIEPRACHPRDILEHVCDTARFRNVTPCLDEEMLLSSANSYFLDISELAAL